MNKFTDSFILGETRNDESTILVKWSGFVDELVQNSVSVFQQRTGENMNPDLFIGTWQLDPALNKYEFGDPPQQGLYIIEPNGTGYLVTMKWTNSAGKALEMQYEGTPDGVEYPANAPGVDSMSMTRVDEKTLDSAAMAGGQVIAYARRTLSEDGQTMTITQSGKTPDSKEFSNLSVYVRQS